MVDFKELGDTRTRVRVELTWQPHGIVEKVGAVLGIDDRQVRADLARFKDFIERRSSETCSWRGEVHPDGG